METKDSLSLKPDWFNSCPFAILALDAEGRIQWVNDALEELLGLRADQLQGHNRESLPSALHKILLEEDEILHLENTDGSHLWLQCMTREGLDARGRQVHFHFYQDVTRTVQLEEQNRLLTETVNALRLSDDLTGLPNQRALAQMLDRQVSHSRRYHNPLSMMLVRVQITSSDLSQDEDVRAPVMLAVSHFFRERFRWADQVARWDEDTFAIVLPETDVEDAEGLKHEVSSGVADIDIPETYQGRVQVKFDFGIASWRKGDDTKTLLRRTAQSLYPLGQ